MMSWERVVRNGGSEERKKLVIQWVLVIAM